MSNQRVAPAVWALVGLLVFAFLLRVFHLTTQGLWFDEAATLDMSDGRSFVENLQRFYHLNTGGERFQPLYNLLMPYWRQTFGDSEAGLRSFSLVASTGAVVFVVLTARNVFGDEHAVWTAALAATSAYSVFYAQEARPYAMLTFLSAAEVFCLSPVIGGWSPERISPWWKRALLLVVLIGSFGSIFFIIFTAALGAAHLLTQRSLKPWLRWWVPVGLALVPALVFFLSTGQAKDPVHSIVVARHGFPVVESLIFVVYGVLVGLTYGPSVESLHTDDRWGLVRTHGLEILSLLVVMGLIVWGLARLLWKPPAQSREERQAGLFLVAAAVIALVPATALAVLTKVTWLPRHSFYLWIPIVLAIPLLRHLKRGEGAALGVPVIVAFIGLNLYSLRKYYFDPAYGKGGYRPVAEFVMQKENLGVPSVLAYGMTRLLRHYGDTRTLDAQIVPGLDVGAEIGATIEKLTQAAPTTLVILNHEDHWRRSHGADLPTMVNARYDLRGTTDFPGFKVYRLAHKDSAAPAR